MKDKKPRKDILFCAGCRNNFYNDHNDYGVKQCWSFKDAKVVKALAVSLYAEPPYNKNNIEYCLNCYQSRGMFYMKNYREIKQGKYKGMCCEASSVDYFENEAKQND